MTDRVSVSITIGGTLGRERLSDLAAIIEAEGLSAEWGGEPFDLSQLPADEALTLMAHEVAWGRLDELEQFCIDEGLLFARWSGAYPGKYGAERVVFDGAGAPTAYPCDDENTVLIARQHLEQLGTMAAVIAYFEAADITIPALRITA